MADHPFDEDSAEPMRRFARSPREAAGEPDSMLCRHLRARRPPPSESQGAAGAGRPSPATYWCLRTMRPAGPDGALALPEDCTDERICFEPAAWPHVES